MVIKPFELTKEEQTVLIELEEAARILSSVPNIFLQTFPNSKKVSQLLLDARKHYSNIGLLTKRLKRLSPVQKSLIGLDSATEKSIFQATNFLPSVMNPVLDQFNQALAAANAHGYAKACTVLIHLAKYLTTVIKAVQTVINLQKQVKTNFNIVLDIELDEAIVLQEFKKLRDLFLESCFKFHGNLLHALNKVLGLIASAEQEHGHKITALSSVLLQSRNMSQEVLRLLNYARAMPQKLELIKNNLEVVINSIGKEPREFGVFIAALGHLPQNLLLIINQLNTVINVIKELFYSHQRVQLR